MLVSLQNPSLHESGLFWPFLCLNYPLIPYIIEMNFLYRAGRMIGGDWSKRKLQGPLSTKQ